MGSLVQSLGIADKVINEIQLIILDVKTHANEAYATAIGLLEQLSDIDSYTGTNTAVTVTEPTKPDPLTLGVIDSDIVVHEPLPPNSVVLGVVETDVTVGTVPDPNIDLTLPAEPVFPTLGDVPEPDTTFDYDEAYYTSQLGDLLYQTLMNEIENGSTGLTAAVEADIYARESERDLLELQNTKDRIATVWAEAGMSLPDGVLVSALSMAEVDYQNKYSDKSRDVRIESFKRADDNAKFVKNLAMQYETVLMDYAGKYWTRKLEAAKTVVLLAEAIYEAWIKYYTLYIERYKGQIEGYKGLAAAKADMADAQAKIYSAQTGYALGKADVDIKEIGAKIDYEQLRVENGKLDVSVFQAFSQYYIGKAEVESKVVLAKIAQLEASIKKYQADAQMYGTEANFDIGKAEIAMKSIYAQVEILKAQIAAAVSASGNIAQVASTLAAGAMSALNANASLSASASESYTGSESESDSYSVSHIYNHDVE